MIAGGVHRPRLENWATSLQPWTMPRPSLDLRVFPGWRLHPLSGNLDGLWSLTVTGHRQVVFRFHRGNAYDVDLVDYH